MNPHKLSDNQLRLLVTELLGEQDTFTIAEAEQRFRDKFPNEANRIDTSDGHSLHQTIGGRLADYSNWKATKRHDYVPKAHGVRMA